MYQKMRKLGVFLSATLLGSSLMAQSAKVKPHQVANQKFLHNPYAKVLKEEHSSSNNMGPVTYQQFTQQTAGKTNAITTVRLGMSGNAYTNVTTEVNLLGTVEGQDWVTFFHRHNQVDLGGHSGQFRVDVSLDKGQTWVTDNDGNDAFNPNSAPYGRIPNALLFNPQGNTDICNVKLVWVSAGHKTPSPANSGPTAAWGHFVHGTAHRIESNCAGNTYDGTFVSTELGTVLYNTALSQGSKDGEFWTVGPKFIRDNQLVQDKLYLWKGMYNQTIERVEWWIHDSLTFNPLQASNGGYQIGTPTMDFSPTGQHGWILVSGMPDGPAPYQHRLYFWKTNDFGATWTPGTINIHTNQQLIDSLTTIFFTDSTMTTLDTIVGKPFPIDYDITVDWQGNPHIVCTFFNQYEGSLNSLDSLGYLSPGLAKSIWDISSPDFGNTWNFTYLRELNTFRGSFGDIGVSAGCQASSNATGDAIAYAWVDDTSATSTDAMQPDLWTFHYDIHNGIAAYPAPKDWASDDATWNGKIILPTMAPLLVSNGGTSYHAPIAFTKILTSDTSPVENWYIQNVNFTFQTPTSKQPQNLTDLMTIAPNPSNGNFNVRMNLKGSDNVSLSIYDILGKVVYTHSANAITEYNQNINISHLPAGVYVVKLQTTQGIAESKIVKQ